MRFKQYILILTLMSPVGVRSESVCFSTTRSCISDLYLNVLRRRPDPEGLRYWTEMVESGATTLSDVERQFRGSPEIRGEVDGVRYREIQRGVEETSDEQAPPQEPEYY